MKTENMLDRYIKTNFKLIENELGLACVAMGVGFISMATYIGILLLLPLLAGTVYLVYKLMRKLLYDSIYGPPASLFQSLPVTTVQMVSCKIFTAGLSLLMVLVVMAAAAVAAAMFSGSPEAFLDDFLQGFIDEGAAAGQLPYVLAGEVLVSVAACFKEGAVILFGVATYQSLPEQNKRWYMKLLVIAEALAIQAVSGNLVETVFTAASLEYTVLRPLLDLAVQTAVLTVLAKLCIRLVDRKYRLA